MLPVLFSIGPVILRSYSVIIVLAFLISGYVFWKKGREEHYPEDELFDAFLLTLLWGFLWSRVGFIMFHFDHFGFQPLKWLDLFSFPGLIPFFGLIAGAWFLFNYAKKQKWNAFEILDFASVAVAIGLALIWVGSFLDGSSFGNVTTLPWGMMFPHVFDKRHPIQIYGFLLYSILFAYLFWVEGKYRTYDWYRNKRHSAQTGFLFCVFCIGYGVIGVMFALISPAQLVIAGMNLDIFFRLFIAGFGGVQLYFRSGRSFLSSKK